MKVLVNNPVQVAVALSERNLESLLDQMRTDGESHAKVRLTEGNVLLTVIAEPDSVYYADRPEVHEAYGIPPKLPAFESISPRCVCQTEPCGACSTPSSAASAPWHAEYDALGDEPGVIYGELDGVRFGIQTS